MKKKYLTRITTVLLVLVMLLGLVPAVLASEDTPSDKTTILACSDFQAEEGNTAGRQQVTEILAAMENDGITSADGFFACGDYDYEFTDTAGGVSALKYAVRNVVSENMIFVQGNHDSAVNTSGLTHSGNNDPSHGKYGVFVINEDDYMWYNEREKTIQRTAQLLTDYFNKKLSQGYDKPIFVLSHLPLHYNMRTKNEGDTVYAGYLVDVLNAAAEKGLNIFFLFGHNHSNGWDDYLGGSSIYLPKGESILVASGTRTKYTSTKISFTYMNAGYTGYYSSVNDGSETALTMTYITITDNEVTVARYDKNGLHDMKSAGVRNAYKSEGPYRPDTTVYSSPQVISLGEITDRTPIADLLESDETLPAYRRINSADELKDGGRYLLVYNSSTDRIMLPQVVTKANDEGVERIGFEIEICPAFGGDTVYGDFTDKEWILTQTDSGWKIGSGGRYITYTSTSDYAVTATLEEEGDLFRIRGDRDAFTIASGIFSFNYNARMLFNFFTSDPAHFYIYEAVGYRVLTEGGSAADSSGEAVTHAFVGDEVILTADAAPDGMCFDRWEVSFGDVTLADATAPTVTVTVPTGGVFLRATYKEVIPEETVPNTGDGGSTTDDSQDKDGNPVVPIVIVVLVLLAALSAVTVVILKKKKK